MQKYVVSILFINYLIIGKLYEMNVNKFNF